MATRRRAERVIEGEVAETFEPRFLTPEQVTWVYRHSGGAALEAMALEARVRKGFAPDEPTSPEQERALATAPLDYQRLVADYERTLAALLPREE